MAKTRVIVVDDSALVRSMLTEIINRQPDMECIAAAADPLVAREMIRNMNPDVITLDVEMPRMDGIDFLSKLMRLRPMPVVMVSTLTERGAEVTMLDVYRRQPANPDWHHVDAALAGDLVSLAVPAGFTPVKVRFAWADSPILNLYGATGLPATPFELAIP